MHILSTQSLAFPPADWADENGLLAVGGDLSPQRLIYAYERGIFPWFDADEPILWWSPPQRMVVDVTHYEPSKKLRQLWRNHPFTCRWNTDFDAVIRQCQRIKRPGQPGTWITDAIVDAYTKLHHMGYAQSVAVYIDDQLVGGLYGVNLQGVFCGESMFSAVSNASKVAFLFLIEQLKSMRYPLLDCQLHNPYLAQLGAFEIDRKLFLQLLAQCQYSRPSEK